MSADDELKERAARLRLVANGGLLEVVGAYPGNADAWEALWLADAAIGAADEEELYEPDLDRA